MPRPLPSINRDSAPYWKSAKAHRLEMQRCKQCSQLRFYPSLSCPFCSSLEFDWVPVSGRGTLYTYTIVHRAPGSPFEDMLPLVVAVVELEEGPVMMSNIVNCLPEEVAVGMRVRIEYEDINDDISLPVFVPG